MSREYILEHFPEIAEIKNDELREKVTVALTTAMERGGWTKLDHVVQRPLESSGSKIRLAAPVSTG